MHSFKNRLALLLASLGVALGGEPYVGDKYASGTLCGVTRDPHGQSLPQAQVTVHSVAESSDLTVVSGSDGAFLVATLHPGQYQVSAKSEGFATLAVAIVTVTNHQTAQMDLSLARSAPDPGMSPAVAKALEAMQKRIEQLEAELKNRSTQEHWEAASVDAPTTGVDQPPRTLLATIGKDPSATPTIPGTLARADEKIVVASNAAARMPAVPTPVQEPQAGGKATLPRGATPVAPPDHIIPEALQAPESTPGVDNFTPFAYADFTWLTGTARTKDTVLDTRFFTPEVRFDTHFITDFNQPRDHSMGGSTEQFRSGEVQMEQISVGGDFHWQNVRGRILTMMGMFGVTTPRNDPSPGVGQWDVRGAYKYVSEAYGGYHFNVNHGLNVDAGIFVSYIGLFSYYNFDNWAYQPSFVSSNTPWFFNGVRIQWFPTNKLKIEPWIINGWQSYNRTNGHHGFGGQILYRPKEWLSLVSNNYGNGTDTLGNPNRVRLHTDDSIEVRYAH